MQLEASAKEKETRRHLQEDGSLAMVASANVARWRVIGFALAGACPMPGPMARAGALPLGECGELQGPRPLVPPLLARAEGARAAIATDSEPGPPAAAAAARWHRWGIARAPEGHRAELPARPGSQSGASRRVPRTARARTTSGHRALSVLQASMVPFKSESTLAVRDRSRGTNLTLNQRAESAPRAPRAGYMMQHTQPGNHDSAWTLQG